MLFFGAADAFYGIVRSDAGSIKGGLAPHKCAYESRGVNVACAVAGIGQLFVFVVSIYTVFVVIDIIII